MYYLRVGSHVRGQTKVVKERSRGLSDVPKITESLRMFVIKIEVLVFLFRHPSFLLVQADKVKEGHIGVLN